ncbi:IS66 family insertion sequence element accessory protein TnpA, partial [Rheinheimera oceanensis]
MAKRAYRNAAQWQQLIDLWHTSELSITEFCQTHQLSTMSFYKWRQRLAEQTEQA